MVRERVSGPWTRLVVSSPQSNAILTRITARLVLKGGYDVQTKLNLCLKLDLHLPSSSLYEAQLTRTLSVWSRLHEELLLLALATFENLAFVSSISSLGSLDCIYNALSK